MATRKFKFKHIAESATVHVGDTGELILDTETKTLKVSDGTTAGGVALNITTTTDNDGGALDTTKNVIFITPGQNYTLGSGNHVGQELSLCLMAGSGSSTITVANAVKSSGGNVQNVTNYSWEFNTGTGLQVLGNIRKCIWDGTRWHLDQP